MAAIGDVGDLQAVLNSVYQGTVKECESREREGKLVGNGHHMAQKIVENVKAELLKRGLFVMFNAPPIVECSWETREAEARVQRYGAMMTAADSKEYERIKPLVPRDSFEALAAKNKAEGGCGCAPGTILCPH